MILNEVMEIVKKTDDSFILVYKYTSGESLYNNYSYNLYGFLYRNEDSFINVSIDLEEVFDQKGETLFDYDTLFLKKRKNKYSYEPKEKVVKLIGGSNYNELINYFLKEEKLLLKNTIYKKF